MRLAFDEIREVAADSTQIARRLKAALDDLLSVAPPQRHPPLERQLALLAAAAAGKSVRPSGVRPVEGWYADDDVARGANARRYGNAF